MLSNITKTCTPWPCNFRPRSFVDIPCNFRTKHPKYLVIFGRLDGPNFRKLRGHGVKSFLWKTIHIWRLTLNLHLSLYMHLYNVKWILPEIVIYDNMKCYLISSTLVLHVFCNLHIMGLLSKDTFHRSAEVKYYCICWVINP